MLRHSGARALEAAKTIPLTRSLSQKSRSWFREVPKAPVSATHDVLNQSSRLPDWSAYEDDQALVDGVRMHGASAFEKHLIKYGHYAGSEATRRRHREANDNPPVLQQFDKFGNRVDQVSFHPAYHALMASAVGGQVPSLAWAFEGDAGAHVARAVLSLLNYQADYGVGCPITMTFAGVPALSHEESVAREWVPRLLAPEYDPRDIPAGDKRGATVGMSMTEKQGGSDVRANTTTAAPLDDNGECFALTGHKWFTSAPMSDAFLTLAQVPGAGVTCFLVPRWLPDGSRNSNFRVMRLKNKMGDRSNASSEVEYAGAWAQRIGLPGRGVSVIVDMVVSTRLDCALGSAGLQRQALRHAMHHACGRSAFGVRLADAPAMRALLGDLAVESEASVAMALYAAQLFDAAAADPGNEDTAALKRLVTAVVKYFVTKRTPQFVYEAMEAHGGNGYVYEWDMPRMFLQSPLNSIWEGSGNTMVLDILRTLAKEPAALPAFLRVLRSAGGDSAPAGYAEALQGLQEQLSKVQAWMVAGDMEAVQFAGRSIVDGMATCLGAAVLLQRSATLGRLPDTDATALQAVADAYIATRLAQGSLPKHNYGAVLTPGMTADTIDAVLSRAAGGPDMSRTQ